MLIYSELESHEQIVCCFSGLSKFIPNYVNVFMFVREIPHFLEINDSLLQLVQRVRDLPNLYCIRGGRRYIRIFKQGYCVIEIEDGEKLLYLGHIYPLSISEIITILEHVNDITAPVDGPFFGNKVLNIINDILFWRR